MDGTDGVVRLSDLDEKAARTLDNFYGMLNEKFKRNTYKVAQSCNGCDISASESTG